MWNKHGYCDLNNISKTTDLHLSNPDGDHYSAVLDLKRFGKTTLNKEAEKGRCSLQDKHNDIVTKNRSF